ncbi:hypothetical protein [Gallibacterium anatis]|uniref:Uncharacterized protein n=1 Tax=Gallibacterium anatis TaxID=750 RepID=A0A1A7P2K9_9PAST|nr:hypothetical protein [Gallibacterium anatis]OBW96682.1 hypothetical protein QV02_03050 [Gallibacterium anatis]OBW98072.1 hypothetical protein QV03_08000 [Gallibacterium anatis]
MQQVTKQDLVEQLADVWTQIEYAMWLLNEDKFKDAARMLRLGMRDATKVEQKLKLLANH